MISDEGFEVLIIYLLIIHSRKKEDRLLEEHISNENFLRATNEYKVLNNFFNSEGAPKDIYTLYKNRNN